MTKPISRRTLVRNLVTLSAVSGMGANPLRIAAQTVLPAAHPNPYPQDVTIFLIGPWLLLAQAPGRPDSMLAMTCDDPMHEYVHGLFTGVRPSDPLPAGEHTVSIASPAYPQTPASSQLTALNEDMLCIDNGAGILSAVATNGEGLRKVYLPVPDEMIPVVFLSPNAVATPPPLFQWPDKPLMQVMPGRVATAMVLRYRNATALSVNGSVLAAQADHYHFEVRVREKPVNQAAEQAHAVHFARKLASLLTYAGRPLDLTFDPGQDSRIVSALRGIDPVEVGVNPKRMTNWVSWNPSDRPTLLRAFSATGDCSVPLVAVAGGPEVPCAAMPARGADGAGLGIL